jgi:hypothetical protein
MPKSDAITSSTDLNRSPSYLEVEAKAGAPMKTAGMPLTGHDADDTGYDPDDIHLGHALSKKFRANYVAEDGRMHQKDIENIIQALDKDEKVISHQKWGMVSLAIVIIATAVGLAVTLDASARSAAEEAKTDPTVFISESAAADEAMLTSPAGGQVQVVQSGALVMIGMLSSLIQEDPLGAIKSMPQSVVLWNPPLAVFQALHPISTTFSPTTFEVVIYCASDHRIVIHDEMHATVFRDAEALSDWNALVAAGDAPDPRTDTATTSRFHFCAACVPIELKSTVTLMNDKLDRAFARFDNATHNRSCEVVAGRSGWDAFASNVPHVCAACAQQSIVHTPQVCLPDPATRIRREEAEQDEAWASHRSEHIQTVLERAARKRGKCM